MDYDTHTKTVIASYYSDVVNVSAPESVPIGNRATMEIIIKAEEELIKNLHNTFDIMKKKEGITSMINILRGYTNRRQSA